MIMNKGYYVYIVECADGSFYTGYTSNVERRINEHNYSIKRGAKYTRSRRPVRLLYFEEYKTISLAMKRENQIKKMSRAQKRELVEKSVQ